jgi:heptosyltransferase-2/heptosyltransferase-3
MRFPKADVFVVTEKKNAAMLANNPDVSGVFPIDKEKHKGLLGSLKFSLDVARQGFDIVVDFQQLPRCRTILGLSRLFGTSVRLSYTPPWYNRWLYTHWQNPVDGYAAMSKASILKPLGIVWDSERPLLNLSPEEIDHARNELNALGVEDDHFLITVDPTHRRETRCWPAGHFGETIKEAAERCPDTRFLVLYGPGEEHVARKVSRHARTEKCIVPEKVLSLREMAGMIERSDLHFGTCSAPRHMAVALGTPSLVVLGSTSPAWTFPGPDHKDLSLGLDCQPCNENSCPSIRCLTDLTPEMVLPELLRRVEMIRLEPCA